MGALLSRHQISNAKDLNATTCARRIHRRSFVVGCVKMNVGCMGEHVKGGSILKLEKNWKAGKMA